MTADSEAPAGRDGPPAGRAERLFAVAALVLYSEGFIGPLFGSENADTPALRLIWLPVYLLTVAFVLPRLRQLCQIAFANWPLLLLVGLCCASALWSIDPGVTLRRGVAIAANTLFGLYLAARYADRDRLRLIACCFGILALSSTAFALALPQYGINADIHAGAWQGVFDQKNYFGQMMVYGAAAFLMLAAADPGNRRKAVAGAVLCMILVLLSASATSLIALLMLLALAAAIRLVLRSRVLAVLAIYVSLTAGVALTLGLLFDPDAVFGLVGRDASLTGRTDIWEPAARMIGARFWLGYGYAAFWEDPDGPAWYIRRALQWDVPSAHNGWIEVWLGIGFVGLAIFVLSFVAALRRAFGTIRIGTAGADLWPFLFLALFLLFSLSESSILRQNNLIWVLYVATVAAYGYRPLRSRPAAAYYPGMARAAAPEDAPATGFWRKEVNPR